MPHCDVLQVFWISFVCRSNDVALASCPAFDCNSGRGHNHRRANETSSRRMRAWRLRHSSPTVRARRLSCTDNSVWAIQLWCRSVRPGTRWVVVGGLIAQGDAAFMADLALAQCITVYARIFTFCGPNTAVTIAATCIAQRPRLTHTHTETTDTRPCERDGCTGNLLLFPG